RLDLWPELPNGSFQIPMCLTLMMSCVPEGFHFSFNYQITHLPNSPPPPHRNENRLSRSARQNALRWLTPAHPLLHGGHPNEVIPLDERNTSHEEEPFDIPAQPWPVGSRLQQQ